MEYSAYTHVYISVNDLQLQVVVFISTWEADLLQSCHVAPLQQPRMEKPLMSTCHVLRLYKWQD